MPQPALREVLAGNLGAKYGALPIVPLPQDDELSLGFIRMAAEILKDKGIYRRDKVVVIPYGERRRLDMMEAKVFCTWILDHLVGSKTKYTRAGEPFQVIKDIPTELAEKTLLSWAFWPKIPEIEAVNPAPMPVIRDGELVLLQEGYDDDSKTLTFPLA